MHVDKDFSGDLIDQQAMFATGGYWNCPDGINNLPVMRFPSEDHARAYEEVRKKMARKKSAVAERS